MCCAVQMKRGSSVENARPENGIRHRRVAASNDRYVTQSCPWAPSGEEAREYLVSEDSGETSELDVPVFIPIA